MYPAKIAMVMVSACLVVFVMSTGLALSAPGIECGDLLSMDFGADVKITKAELVPPKDKLPAHCRVEGTRAPKDAFMINLPTVWNGRYCQAGNGGAGGAIKIEHQLPALKKGFVTAAGYAGHTQPRPPFGWAKPINDPVVQQIVDDYCFESVHETAVLAKRIVKAYYGSDPVYSYYNACSTGGRQGLIEVQRYPGDFDGVIVGAPVHELTRITQRGIWEGQALSGPGKIQLEKLSLLAASVMRECDGIDGLKDGLIDDPRRCDFDANKDLPACPDDKDGPDCFTEAQRDAVAKIYSGPPGVAATPGEAFGSEAMAPGPKGKPQSIWLRGVISGKPGRPSRGLMMGKGFVQWLGLPPSGKGGKDFDWTQYNFNGPDPQNVLDNMSARCDAIDPNLWAFKLRGGKLIHYQGWADPTTGPYQSVDYYESVLEFMGEKKTRDFYKLYMFPGTSHCGQGNGCFDRDGDLAELFLALVDWVEHGIEPESWVGSQIVKGKVVRTRPQCPYPQVARYSGSGSIDDAKNFTCVDQN